MMCMLKRRSRSDCAFIFAVVLLCSFSNIASAVNRPVPAPPYMLIGKALAAFGAFLYVFADDTPSFELPDYSEMMPELYLKYEFKKWEEPVSLISEVSSELSAEKSRWNLDGQYQRQDKRQTGDLEYSVFPVELTPVTKTPEDFALRNRRKTPYNVTESTGTPENWNNYIFRELYWKLQSVYVGEGRNKEKMQSYYQPILSACLDFTGEISIPVEGQSLLSKCVIAASSRLKVASDEAGIYAIGEPESMHMKNYVESNRKIRLPVFSVHRDGINVAWQLFYVVRGVDGGFNLISIK